MVKARQKFRGRSRPETSETETPRLYRNHGFGLATLVSPAKRNYVFLRMYDYVA